jgi:hypothetical protein
MALERKTYTYTPFTYKEYEKSDEVKAAEEKQNGFATKLENWTPTAFSKQEEYNKLFTDYQNRPDFTYDFNADALYQQYKDKYIQQGKMAMADTMGQAAAMTGGYGNSYAQTVGNQAYQASLQNLNDIIPELYQMAYDRHNQKGQDMLNMIGLLSNERDYERNMDNDAYGRLAANLDYATTNAQNLFNRDYGIYSDGRSFYQTEHGNEEKYKYQDVADANAFAQWLEEQELNKRQVDLTERQVALAEKEHSAKYDTSTKAYTGKTKTGDSYNNGGLTTAQIKELQAAIGVEADGYYGSQSSKAADGLSAEEAYKKYVGKSPKQDDPVGFSGSSYSDAVKYMESKGVPSGNASGVMTASEWNRRKSSYQAHGQGSASVKNYSSYSEYLKNFVEYAVETYGR